MLKIFKYFFFLIVLFISYIFIDIFVIKYEILNRDFIIKNGDNYYKIYDRLGLKYTISDKIFLRLNNKYLKLIPGEVKLELKQTKYEIFNALSNAKLKQISLVIPEGFTQKQIFERIEKLGLASQDEMLNALNSIDFPYYHLKDNYDGYLYPETYIFDVNTKPIDIAKTILGEFLKHFPKEKYLDKKKFYDNLKLASIVEFETAETNQKDLVAGVFKKRLRIGMKLQSDASLKYELNRRVLKKDLLSVDSKYNTYKYVGLPPSPICNPSKETILITMNAKENDYLYFFMEDGKTFYSKTHEEHLRKRRGYR